MLHKRRGSRGLFNSYSRGKLVRKIAGCVVGLHHPDIIDDTQQEVERDKNGFPFLFVLLCTWEKHTLKTLSNQASMTVTCQRWRLIRAASNRIDAQEMQCCTVYCKMLQ